MSKSMKDKTTNSKSTPLASYKQSKKVLTPPLATLPNIVLSSWMNDRMPEMLWAVLIRNKHPGDMGYAIFRDVLRWLAENKGANEVGGVTHTDIANFDQNLKENFISRIVDQAGTDALKPLLLLKELPSYDSWKEAMKSAKLEPEKDWDILAHSVSDVLFHQTQEATDIRWVKLMGALLGGKMQLPSEMLNGFNHYPNRYDQRKVRPSIRSTEMMIGMASKEEGAVANPWPNQFWRFAQKETVCIPEIDTFSKDEITKKYDDIDNDKKYYDLPLRGVRDALIDHFFATSTSTAIDARHEAVFGLALYAVDTFIENSILLTSSTTSGRVTARIIFETYINLKYLLDQEKVGNLLWDTYRDYGVGQISLIERKYEDEGYESSMVDIKKIDSIANEDKWSEYVPINIGNWDASDLRTISIKVGEKDLYDMYYPYTSGFIHASWGAVREVSMQTCFNPLHRLHRIPSYGISVLPSVNEDCRQVLNKLFGLVDQAYPDFKNQIDKQPEKIEKAPT